MDQIIYSIYKRRQIEREFYRGLNKIQREFEQSIKSKGAMKITGETKIKDILTDEYEVDNVDAIGGVLMIGYHKKEVKDFNWYKEQYWDNEIPKDCRMALTIPYHNLKAEIWKGVPFEIRIGLLKFICDDLNREQNDRFSYVFILDQFDNHEKFDNVFMGKVRSICPKEFINSLFE